MCHFESLKNGAIDLADVALMNDALDVVAINSHKAQQYNESKNVR